MKKRALLMAIGLQLTVGVGLSWGATQITTLPYTISASGEYFLNGNLTSTTGAGITLGAAASNVSIDFKGHTILGGGKTGAAISTASPITNVEIANGTIAGFTRGIALYSVEGVRVINMRIRNITHDVNGDTTCDLGPNSLIKDSTFANNYRGPSAGNGSLITGNTSLNSQGMGLVCGANCTIIGNTVTGSAMEGIGANQGRGTIKNNTVSGSGDWGIDGGGYNLIDGNTATDNVNGNIFDDGTNAMGLNIM